MPDGYWEPMCCVSDTDMAMSAAFADDLIDGLFLSFVLRSLYYYLMSGDGGKSEKVSSLVGFDNDNQFPPMLTWAL